MTPEEFNQFIEWFRQTYGVMQDISLGFFPTPESVAGTPYGQYWLKYVKSVQQPQSQPQAQPQGTVFGAQQGDPNALPSQIFLSSRGKYVPVNYTLIGSTTFTDELGETVTADLYLPVPETADLSSESLNEILSQVYAKNTDTGELLLGGRSLNPAEVKSLKLDQKGLSTQVSNLSLRKSVQDRGINIDTPEMQEFLDFYSQQVAQGSLVDLDYLQGELDKVKQFPEYLNILRAQGSFPGELPEYWDKADIQMAQAYAGTLQKAGEGQFESEIEKLQARIKGLSDIVSEWQPKFKAGIYNAQTRLPTVTSQIAAAALESTRLAQERLAAIERGEAQPVTRTTAGSEIPSFMVKQAQEQEIPLKNLAGLSRQFSDNPQSPEFANLTPQQRDTLRVIGLESQDEGAGAELQRQQEQQRLRGLAAQQNPQWGDLVKRAREAQRRVSI